MYGPGKASPRRAPSSKHLEVVRERAVEMAVGRGEHSRQRQQQVRRLGRPRAGASSGSDEVPGVMWVPGALVKDLPFTLREVEP